MTARLLSLFLSGLWIGLVVGACGMSLYLGPKRPK